MIKFLVTQKFRFDLGISFIVFVNFILLVITASDNIMAALNNYVSITVNKEVMIIIAVMMAFFSTWLFGLILDKIIRYQQNLMNVHNERNPQILEILENTRKLVQEKERGENCQK